MNRTICTLMEEDKKIRISEILYRAYMYCTQKNLFSLQTYLKREYRVKGALPKYT